MHGNSNIKFKYIVQIKRNIDSIKMQGTTEKTTKTCTCIHLIKLFLGHHVCRSSTHKKPIMQQGVWQADPQFHVIMWDSLTILFKASHFSTHQAQPPALSKINYVIIAIILQLKWLIWADICYCGIQKASDGVFQRAGFVWSNWLMCQDILCNIEGKTKPF